MRVRFTSLFLAILFVPTLALADSHKADFTGGYADGTGGSRLKGFGVAAALHAPATVPHRLTWLVDYSHRSGTDNGVTVKQDAWLFGARAMLTPPSCKLKFFAEGLFGPVNTNDGVTSGYKKAGGIGLGAEYFPTKAVPTQRGYDTQTNLGLRVQVDHVWRSERGDFTRVYVGLVYRLIEAKK
jgi:hypothetical protein